MDAFATSQTVLAKVKEATVLAPRIVLDSAIAEPFRPFRFGMSSGKIFEVRHPAMIRGGRSNLMVFALDSDQPEVFDEWQSVPLMLIESITQLEVPAA